MEKLCLIKKQVILINKKKNLKNLNYFLDLNISSVNIYPTTVKTKYENKIWYEIINEKKEKTYSYRHRINRS